MTKQAVWTRRVPRRKVLEGLGKLALSAPALIALGCSAKDDADDMTGVLPSQGAGMGGSAPAAQTAGSGGSSSAGSSATGMQGGAGASAAGSGGMSATTAGAGGSEPSAAGSSGAAGNDEAGSMAAGSDSPDAGTDTMIATPDMFDDAASCTLTITDIEGPFLIEDDEVPSDASMIRSDIREGMPGVEFRLSFRLLDAQNDCAPIPDALMYIWHCNASGYYSGFEGQDPTMAYAGPANPSPANDDRFCRGVQTSNADGIVTFTTVYPGWYTGRPIHIHLIARFADETMRMITTQLYFAADFTTEVHESEPAYMARAAAMPAGSRNPPAGNHAMPTMTHVPGLVTGLMNVIAAKV